MSDKGVQKDYVDRRFRSAEARREDSLSAFEQARRGKIERRVRRAALDDAARSLATLPKPLKPPGRR